MRLLRLAYEDIFDTIKKPTLPDDASYTPLKLSEGQKNPFYSGENLDWKRDLPKDFNFPLLINSIGHNLKEVSSLRSTYAGFIKLYINEANVITEYGIFLSPLEFRNLAEQDYAEDFKRKIIKENGLSHMPKSEIESLEKYVFAPDYSIMSIVNSASDSFFENAGWDLDRDEVYRELGEDPRDTVLSWDHAKEKYLTGLWEKESDYIVEALKKDPLGYLWDNMGVELEMALKHGDVELDYETLSEDWAKRASNKDLSSIIGSEFVMMYQNKYPVVKFRYA